MNERYAIALPDGTLLAVPPMPDWLSYNARTRVFEYVLRRQVGLAVALIDIEKELNKRARENVPGPYVTAALALFDSPTPNGRAA